jgi:hypothetical protein
MNRFSTLLWNYNKANRNNLVSLSFLCQIVNAIDAPNYQRLPRPLYATAELYQIMLHCWKHEPSERPTFIQLEKTLREVNTNIVIDRQNKNNPFLRFRLK